MNTSYAQGISDNFWMGSELTFIPMNGISLTSFGARYVTGSHMFFGTVGQQPDFKARSPFRIKQYNEAAVCEEGE